MESVHIDQEIIYGNLIWKSKKQVQYSFLSSERKVDAFKRV